MPIIHSPLKGPWYQVAGGVWVIDSKLELLEFKAQLMDQERSGLDSETEGCNPAEESPVGRAFIKCWSASWIDPKLGKHPHTKRPLANRVFIPNFGIAEREGWLYEMADYFESPVHKKGGHNFFSFDTHAWANHGIKLRGVAFDTLRKLRLEDVTRMENDLKTWLTEEPFCYELYGGFKEVFSKPKPLTYGMCQWFMENKPEIFAPAKPKLSLVDAPIAYMDDLDGRRIPHWEVKKRGCATRQRMEGTTCKGCGSPLVAEQSASERVMVSWDEIINSRQWMDILVDYATMDSKGTLELEPHVDEMLDRQAWVKDKTMLDFYNERLNPYMHVLIGMEEHGQTIDPTWCAEQSAKASRDIEIYERKLVEWTGVTMNFGSAPQLQHLLYGVGPKIVTKGMTQPIIGRGFPIPPMAKRDYKTQEQSLPTDDKALSWLQGHVQEKRDREALKTLRELRKAEGTKSKYLDKLPRCMDAAGRIHCQIAPDTETGRLAARNPPTQQIPNAEKGDPYLVREAFTVDPGQALIVGDWSQLEPRVLAHFLIRLFDDHSLAEDLKTGDVYLAAALKSQPWVFPHGASVKDIKSVIKAENHEDIDSATGKPRWKVFKKCRATFKAIVLGVNYGKTEYGLGMDLRDEDDNPIGTEAAKKYLDDYFAANPGIKRFQKWAASYAFKTGAARTLLGRYRKIPQLRWENRAARKRGERQAGNTPIQGTAADIAMMAQLKLNTLKIPELTDLGFFHQELYDLGEERNGVYMPPRNNAQAHDELHEVGPFRHRVRIMEIVKDVMENALDEPLVVPLPAEVKWGITWNECK